MRRASCAYWGVFLNDFQLYYLDENESIYNLGQENVKVLRFLETFGQSETAKDEGAKKKSKSKNKEKKPGTKKSYAMFYLGRKVTMVAQSRSITAISEAVDLTFNDMSILDEQPTKNSKLLQRS